MIGKTLAHYNILSQLGEGGMGEVYLAEDTRLKRQVALKVLPEALRKDVDRLRRFRREAEAAAKLKHPNIATIYAFEEAGDMAFITMEYVEGKPLHEVIADDGLPLDFFFSLFNPLADAICHAHNRGVYHRDLKPANVLVTEEGHPKILDFGLARIEGIDDDDADATKAGADAPTASLTRVGTIIGTPAYMSPEQATGDRGDRQSDIFSFGVMMYEALSGRRPFSGEHYVSVISSILKDEPAPVTDLKTGLPYTLGRVVRHSLQKDIDVRYQTMRDVYRDLEDARTENEEGMTGISPVAAGGHTPGWRRSFPMVAGLALILVTAAVTWFTAERRLAPPDPPVRKFQIPVDNIDPAGLAISPDGRMIAYVREKQLWIRRMDQLDGRVIAETAGAANLFWAPGSDFIGFRIESTLWKIAPDGGNRTRLCELPRGRIRGITWGSQGTITLSAANMRSMELWSVSDRGGDIQPFITPDEVDEEWGPATPHYLPDGRTLIYTIWTKGDSLTAADLAERYRNDQGLEFFISFARVVSSRIVVHSPETGRRTLEGLAEGFLSVAGYTSDHLLYYRNGLPGEGDLWAVPFSAASGEVTGESFPVIQDVNAVSVSGDGTLIYRTSIRPPQQLAWVDRRGRIDGMIGQMHESIDGPVISPDGTRIAVTGTEDGDEDIWIHEVDRAVKTRLTFLREDVGTPVWMPDGRRIVFDHSGARRFRGFTPGFLYSISADGGGTHQPLIPDSLAGAEPTWSGDGRYLVYSVRNELWYMDYSGDRKPAPLIQLNRRYTREPSLSPDGRFLAYTSNESGRVEVYVTRFPSGEGKWQVSTNGGSKPRWSQQGNEIFYAEEDKLMVVQVLTGSGFRTSSPETLFEERRIRAVPFRYAGYDVTPDGQRFVVVQNVGESRPMMTIVENWASEFK